MNVLLDHFSAFRDGFIGTLSITAVSAVIALVLGVVMAGFRVSPFLRSGSSERPGSPCSATRR